MDISKTIIDLANKKQTIHLIGICGVSMKSLAKMLSEKGAHVQGSNKDPSPVMEELRSCGIDVFVGHDASYVENAALIIKTAAIHDDNPEIIRARALDIPIITRAEAWGAVMRDFNNRLCIAGMHGKTTTSGMACCAAVAGGLDPTVMLGGDLPIIGGSFRLGGTSLFIAESCEYCNSYHSFCPSVSVILNVDADHLDFFSGLDEIIQSFKTFAMRTDPDGAVIVNMDDPNSMSAVQGVPRKIITFGLSENACVHAQNLVDNNGYYSFDIIINSKKYSHVLLNVPGLHNVYNTLACAAALSRLGLCGDSFADGISKFSGTGRRFEKHGHTSSGALVIDDYAHHPREIEATLKTAREMGFNKIYCVFQPHTYSRTAALINQFAHALSLADKVLLAEIYAARESNTYGISSQNLAEKIEGAEYFTSFSEICSCLEKKAGNNDLILTMGAGDIFKIAQMLCDSKAHEI